MQFLYRGSKVFSLLVWVALSAPMELSGLEPSAAVDVGEPFSASPEQLRGRPTALEVRPEDHVHLLWQEVQVTVDGEDRRRIRRHQIYRLLSPASLEYGWARAAVHWDPWHQERPTLAARVLPPEGGERRLDPSQIEEHPVASGTRLILTDQRKLEGPLPGIEVGAVVEVLTEVVDQAPLLDVGTVGSFHLGGNLPTEGSRVVVSVPQGHPLRTAVLGPAEQVETVQVREWQEDGRLYREFEMGPTAEILVGEAALPPEVELYPTVHVATAPSWNAVARAYAAVVEEQLAGTELRRVVRRQLRGLRPGADRRVRIDRLLDWLHDRVRYTGLELGEAAIVPRTPQETRRRGYGDCKDKSTLLVALLREAGMEAHVALLRVGRRRDIEPEMPGFGGFDHAIVMVPTVGEEAAVWIDPTDPHARAGTLPTGGQGRWALVASPETEDLVRTPEASPEANRIERLYTVQVPPLGKGRVTARARLQGHLERAYRGWWEGLGAEQKEDFFEEWGAALRGTVENWGVQGEGDLQTPLTLTLAVEDSSLAVSDLAEAEVVLSPADILRQLPDLLREKPEEEEEEEEADPEGTADSRRPEPKAWPRNYPLLLPFAHAAEYRYRIVPPPGYRLTEAPEEETRSLGPAEFRRTISIEESGTVEAVLQLSTGPRRLDPEAAATLRDAAVALIEEGDWRLKFHNVAEVALAAGEVEEAIAELRRLIADHPEDGLLRARLARAYLKAGLGEAARRESAVALELAPDEPRVHTVRGVVLQHDLLGRSFAPGFDDAGTVAAFRRALELEPDRELHYRNLAQHLERNPQGVVRGRGARLEEAIEVLRRRREELGDGNLDRNLVLNLLHAERREEARELAEELPERFDARAFKLAALAAAPPAGETADDQPAAGALAAARKIEDEGARHQALQDAGNELVRLRLYPAAAALLEAAVAVSGENVAAQRRRLSLIARTRPHEERALPEDPIEAFAHRLVRSHFLGAEDSDPNPDSDLGTEWESVEDLLAPHLPAEAVDGIQVGLLRRHRLGSNVAPAGKVDLMLAGIKVDTQILRQEGAEGGTTPDGETEPAGYRVRIRMADFARTSEVHFLLPTSEGLRLLATDRYLAPLGMAALEAVANGRLEEARQWLNWARREIDSRWDPEDPFDGNPLARLWRLGRSGDQTEEQIRLAAAALTVGVGGDRGAAAVEVLRSALPREEGVRRDAVAAALLTGHLRLNHHVAAADLAQEMLAWVPTSRRALFALTEALSVEGRWAELKTAATARLERLPGDVLALRLLADAAVGVGDLVAAQEHLHRVVENEEAEGDDFNNLAWYRLVSGILDERTIELAEQAVSRDQNGGDSAALHTLASVYAEMGRPEEARRFLHQALDARGPANPAPDLDDWYVQGRITEYYGLPRLAREAYRRSEPPGGAEDAAAVWVLAQRRLAVLGEASRRESSAGH